MTSYSTQGIFLYSEQPARNSFDPTKIPTSPYSRSITSTDAADTDEGVSKKIAHKRSPPLSIPSHKRVKATTAELTSTSAQTAMTINSIYQNTSTDMPTSAQPRALSPSQALGKQHTPTPCAPTQKSHLSENPTKLMQWHQHQLKADPQQLQEKQNHPHTRPDSLAALQKQSLLSNHTVSTAALVAESTASSFVHAHDKDALRRVVHCAVERDRRERIKVKLDELKAAIPACAGMDTTQKLVLLENAVIYIKSLEALVGDLENQLNLYESPSHSNPPHRELNVDMRRGHLQDGEAVIPLHNYRHSAQNSRWISKHQPAYLTSRYPVQSNTNQLFRIPVKTEQLEYTPVSSPTLNSSFSHSFTPAYGSTIYTPRQYYPNASIPAYSKQVVSYPSAISRSVRINRRTDRQHSRQSPAPLNMDFVEYTQRNSRACDHYPHKQQYQHHAFIPLSDNGGSYVHSPNNVLSVGNLLCS
ncbi:hypothetical protein BASA60_001748 [Batrachochytrium salamandrivorans]|nr:hypothetical protein BASA60_001748 [Batrachochytrium salamandrivorans]